MVDWEKRQEDENIKKFEYAYSKKCFLDEIDNFHNYVRVTIWVTILVVSQHVTICQRFCHSNHVI